MYFWYEYIVVILGMLGVITLLTTLRALYFREFEAVLWGFLTFVFFSSSTGLHYGDGYMLPNSEDDYKLAAFVKQNSTDFEELGIKRRAMWAIVNYGRSPIVKRGI